MALSASTLHAQAADALRGHVRGIGNAPLAGAQVTATLAGEPARSTRTDNEGAYSITFANANGPYSLAAVMVGYAPMTKQVPARAAGTTRPDIDFQLDPVAQRLAAVTTRAVRQRPQRSDGTGAGPGEAGSTSNTSNGLTGDLTGDIAAAMATVPGLLITPDPNGGLPSISAFGLSGDQNSLTLNGMNFGGGSIPRDGLALRVASSTYDPGRGGFSGVQTTLRLPSGGNSLTQFLHLTAEDPHLQGTPPGSVQLGTQYSRQILSGSWNGPIAEDKAYYNSSFQFSRRASDLPALGSIDAASLQALGLSPDSVRRLSSLLGPLGIPNSVSAVPSGRITTNASTLSRFDWSPGATSRTGNVLNLIVGGHYSDNAGARASPTALAAHSGNARSWSAQAQSNVSRFIGPVLNEANGSFVVASNRAQPYLFLPDGRVLVTSSFADGSAASSTVRVGGNSNAESNQTSWSAQLRNETSWFTWDNRHQIRVTADGRLDHDALTQSANRLGTFSYNSLADFAANRPASFTRTLGVRETTGQQAIGAIGVGDVFRPFPALRLQYGVRVEASTFGDAPRENPIVQQVFGRSTSRVPSSFAISPMIGFSRNYNSWRGGSFTGGIREYAGTLSSQAVENVSRLTGLGDAVQQLTCVGTAVPTPQWSTYQTNLGAIPSQCADGTGGTVFAQSTPPVSVFAPNYTPSRRWGAALGWSGRIRPSLVGSISGNYSLNMRRPSSFDLNFNPVTRFALASENGRPIFVAPTSIVPTTGSVTATDSRLDPRFATVNELRSDLRSDATQLIFGLSSNGDGRPEGFGITTSYRAFYTFTSNRDQTRGFSGTTAGDPRDVFWSASGLPQHSFQLLGSINIPRWFKLDAFGRISSSRKYTPMVAGDINGDGYVNDRAMVFDPASAPDPALGAAMSSLLASAPQRARDCLTSQLRAVASRNSCSGPWSQSLNLAISPDIGRVGLADRGAISFVVTNALGAADQLFHGSNKLRNWGTTLVPDQTLLNVRGFDPSTRRFRYDVNPSFGSTTASAAAARLPFVIAIDVQVRLGPDRDAQALKSFFKPRAADATKVLSEEQIKARLEQDEQNNFQDIARRKDALKLTPEQVLGLNALAKRFDSVRDSIYTDLSRYLGSLKGDYQRPVVRKRWHDAFVAIAHVYVAAGPTVQTLLSEEQFAALSPSVTAYFGMDEATFQRLMASTNFGTLMELITGEGPN